MTMDLKTALAAVEAVRAEAEAADRRTGLKVCAFVPAGGAAAAAAGVAEALAVVLARARENFAAETVAKTRALVEQAREMSRPHAFRRPERREPTTPTTTHCDLCGALESDPIHAVRREEQPHACTSALVEGKCYRCGHDQFHPLHQEPGGTP